MVVAIRRSWATLLTHVERVTDPFPLTIGGLLLSGLSLWATTWYGYGSLDLILLVAGMLGFTLVCLSGLAVTTAALILRSTLKGPGDDRRLELECGYAGRTGFEVRNLAWVPLVTVTWTWDSPDVKVVLKPSWGTQREQVTPRRRGEHTQIVRKIIVTDPFGLARIAFRMEEPRSMRFLPGTGELKKLHVVQGLAGGDAISHPEGPPAGDRFDMRRYMAGDPIRYVLWKVFAKSRDLVIRTPERAIAPTRQTVAYLVSGANDQAAAGAARVAIAGGAFGHDWTLGCDGSTETASTVGEAMALIVKSAHVPDEAGGRGLNQFLASGVGGARRAIVFVPATPGPWIDAVLAAAKTHATAHAPIDLVVCTDGVLPDRRRSLLARLVLRPPANVEAITPPTPASEIREVLRRLGRIGTRVQLVDRATGRVFQREQFGGLGI